MTAQIREKLRYNGKIYHLAAEPLYPYLVEHKIKFVSSSTACWRGYVGSWLIEEDHLYLVDLKAYIPSDNSRWGGEEVGLDYLFPGQDKVLADWFSGEIRIPHGEMIRYVHMGYASVYEKELFLRFVNGKYVSCREIDNTRLKDDKNAIAEKEMDGIWESIFGVKRSKLPPKKKSWWKKLLGILCGVFVLVIGWLVFAIVAMPLHVMITVIVVAAILYLLLRREHWLLWISTILLFMVIGVYYVFNNDLPGPMMWSIADRPIDTPSQWFNNYRFFWWGVIINKTFQCAGLISFCIIAIFKLMKILIKKWIR